MDLLQTEFPFTLPCGFVDPQGNRIRHGLMRRATALDEVDPLEDRRVQRNEAYAGILLLSRVVTHLGSISPVSPQMIGTLFATDFLFLQELYERINTNGSSLIETQCPACGERFALDVAGGEQM
jgi:hypothetical protein